MRPRRRATPSRPAVPGALAPALALSSLLLAAGAAWPAGQEAPEGEAAVLERPGCAARESGIRGRVLDAETGVPLPGARVSARSATGPAAEAEADGAGEFALCGVVPGPVQGEERAPVAGALVTLEPLGIQALTDSAGAFRIDPLPPAGYRIAVHHVDGLRVDSLEVRPRSLVRFESRLIAREVVLGSVRTAPGLRGEEDVRRRPERKRRSRDGRAGPERAREAEAGEGARGALPRITGVRLDRALLRAWRAERLSQALTLVPGLELVRRCVGRLTTACGFLPRLAAEAEAGCEEAAVYVDGRRVPTGPLLRLLERLRVEEFAAVQVVAPGEPLPEEVGEGSAECGAVLVWRGPDG